VNSTGARRAATPAWPRFHKEPGRADDPVPVSAARDRHSGVPKSPANFNILDRHAQLGSGMNLLASLTNVAKESASIFRIMCERWI
jgi:hypothetical protein